MTTYLRFDMCMQRSRTRQVAWATVETTENTFDCGTVMHPSNDGLWDVYTPTPGDAESQHLYQQGVIASVVSVYACGRTIARGRNLSAALAILASVGVVGVVAGGRRRQRRRVRDGERR